ncbi:hypothetical protein GE09DRAFT_1106422 [Coniochaeta sp. 2T2.1]|nr:hypothetical protein GE09DRAFT_1106422 [Coniochaeta sp. 2T2.1]
MSDPVARTNSPYSDPNVKGPRSQILSSGTELRKMISGSVNKTGLHPSGVIPQVEHTELGMTLETEHDDDNGHI